MSIHFCPTERCTIEQAEDNANILSIEIMKKNQNSYWVCDGDRSAFLEVEDGWIRGAHQANARCTVDNTVALIAELTNCRWVDEYDHEAMQVFLFWYDEEILLEAQNCIEDRIQVDPNDEWGTRDQELENQLNYLYSRRKKFGVEGDLLIAEPLNRKECLRGFA